MKRARREMWNRGQRSRVPYTRTPPSINLAYEPPVEANILNNEAAQGTHLHSAAQANPQVFEGLPGASQLYQNPSSRNQWLSENSPMVDPPPYPISSSVPTSRIHAIPEHSAIENKIYSNVRRHNRRPLKVTHLQNAQNEPVGDQQQSQMFPYASSNQSSTGNHTISAPRMGEDTSCFPEEPGPLHLSRLHVPRTPDSPFVTVNPMYHSQPAWTPQPRNSHFKYQHTKLS